VAVWLSCVGSLSANERDTTHKLLTFDDLYGWTDDNHARALNVFLNTCPDMKDPDWLAL